MSVFNPYRRRFLRDCGNQGMVASLNKPIIAGLLASVGDSACSGSNDRANSTAVNSAAMPMRVSGSGMDLGINLGWVNTWSGGVPFVNLCYLMPVFMRVVGSGEFTQSQGCLEANVATDIFRGELLNGGNALPSGRYTVINPDGCNIGFGAFNSEAAPNNHAFTTEKRFSFNYTTGNYLAVFVKGSLTRNTGNLVVLLPGAEESWASGNVWNPDFLSYHQALGTKVLRTMDWTQASSNLETDWSDRSMPDQISFALPVGGIIGRVIPWELICDLANRLEKDLWICIPHRATADYVKQLAKLLHKHLKEGRKPWIELANEVWNTANPWGNGTHWVNCLTYTRYTADADEKAGVYRLSGHGLSSGAEVRSFSTKENRIANATENWQASLGVKSVVEVVDANSFRLHSMSLGGPVVPISPGQKNLLFIKMAELGQPGVTPKALDTNYCSLSQRNWEILQSELGSGNFKKILGSFFKEYTARRAEAAPAADFLANAPYFQGGWWGATVEISNGRLTPGVWASQLASMRFALYPESASPSLFDIKSGRGAVNYQALDYTLAMSIAVDASQQTAYTNFAPVLGLENGKSFKAFFVMTDANGHDWPISTVVTTSSTTSRVFVEDSFSNQSLRNQIHALFDANFIRDASSAARGIPMICYEGGLHFHERPPANLKRWLADYQESPEFADAIGKYLHMLANSGAAAFCYYSDVMGTSFQLSNGYADTADNRFQKYASFQGHVDAKAPLSVVNVQAGEIRSAPGYPSTVCTFPDEGLKYSIVSGDTKGNYRIEGNRLQILNGNQIDFGVSSSVSLTIGATDDNAFTTFKVLFSTGGA